MGYWKTDDDLRALQAQLTPTAFVALAATASTFTAAGSFSIIPLATVTTDTAAAFNTSTHLYTVPTTGTYSVTALVRTADGIASGIGVAVGVGTATADEPTVAWYATGGAYRNSFVYSKTAHFNAGDQVRLFVFADASGGASVNFSAAALNLALLG